MLKVLVFELKFQKGEISDRYTCLLYQKIEIQIYS